MGAVDQVLEVGRRFIAMPFDLALDPGHAGVVHMIRMREAERLTT